MNNIEFAQLYENTIRNEFLMTATSETEVQFINKIFDDCVCINPRQEDNHFIKIKAHPNMTDDANGVSRKLKNIQLNLPLVFRYIIETLIEYEPLESKYDFIKLAIKIFLRLYDVSSVEINKNQCLMLMYLHNHGAYTSPLNEDQIVHAIETHKLPFSVEEYYNIIRFLQKMNSIYITNGHILLNEIVELSFEDC